MKNPKLKATLMLNLFLEEVMMLAGHGASTGATNEERQISLKTLQYSAGLAQVAFKLLHQPDCTFYQEQFESMILSAQTARDKLRGYPATPVYPRVLDS